ncbi:MAG TPA: DUF6319 family protein [Pseudonocardiaceae bacterium]|jgi:hypothetical protein|nr:DUF6319 family protein [Pseudonocardiaceae bacterium]
MAVDQDLSNAASTDTPAPATTTPATQAAAPAAAGSSEEADKPAEAPAEKPKRKPRTQSSAKKTRTVELTLTVTGTADGEWQAELVHGGKRVVAGLAVAAAAVSRAAKELHPDIAGGIDEVITAAREQHQKRAAELQAELEKVQAALAELED